MNTEDKVKKIIIEQLGVEPKFITPTSCLVNDLGADSMDVLELILTIETDFKIKFTESDERKIKTFQDLVSCVEGKQ